VKNVKTATQYVTLCTLCTLLAGCVGYQQRFSQEVDGLKEVYSTRSLGIGYKVKQDDNNLDYTWSADGAGRLTVEKAHEGMDTFSAFQAGLQAGQSIATTGIQAAVPIIRDRVQPKEKEEE
jgi:hypothetical protein